jgi:uncharacterized repeat protein (TIGR01451 family)
MCYHINKNTKIILITFILLFNTVANAVDINVFFSPNTINPSERSTLFIELKNTNNKPTTNTSFTNVLPEGLFVIKNTLKKNCLGVSATYNDVISGTLKITGMTIPAREGNNPGLCSISVGVTTNREGSLSMKLKMKTLNK